MFDAEFYFALPPAIPTETEWPEAFDRTGQGTTNFSGNRPAISTNAQRGSKRIKRGKVTFETAAKLVTEYFEELRATRRLSPGVLRNYKSDVEDYLSWLQRRGIQNLRDVSAVEIQQYLQHLRGGHSLRRNQNSAASNRAPDENGHHFERATGNRKFLAASTIATRMSILRGWHGFVAKRYGGIDPMLSLPNEAVSYENSAVLSAEQINILLATPNLNTGKGLRAHAILCLLCDGFSPAEISDLSIDAVVNPDAVSRMTQLSLQTYNERARPHFLAQLRTKGLYSRRVFFSNRGTPLMGIGIGNIVKQQALAARLPFRLTASMLQRTGAARRARGLDLSDQSGMEVAALPRRAQLRHAFIKAHPRA